MKASSVSFLMLFLIIRKTHSTILCSSINPVNCRCYEATLLEPEEEVRISCPDLRSYIVEYAINYGMKLECLTPESPYAPALFKNMNTTEIVSFEFTHCPPPNISFGEVLEGYTVNSLKFISNNNSIKSESFEGLNDLLTLILQRNYIPFISKDLFRHVKQLQVLRLNDNRIRKLDDESFSYLSNLTHLELGGNPIEVLPEKVFFRLYNLKVLHVYKIQLKNLSTDVFKDLSSLKILDISSNYLEKLPDSIFDSLLNVEQVNLRSNKLKYLPEDLFTSTLKLKVLDFGRNYELDELPETFLFTSHKLENIAMDNCNITSIPDHFFSHANQLKIIKINNNRIYSLSNDLFRNNSNVRKLYMNYNRLTTLPSEIFNKQYRLETLGISKNNLQYLPRNIFRNLINLKVINLSYNNITYLEPEIFKNMVELEVFDISNNKLTKIHELGIRNLRKINICKNQLTEFPNFNWNFNLEEVNLQYNNIKSLTVPLVISQRTIIKLGWNNISHIDISELTTIRNDYDVQKIVFSPPKWFLFPNPISCDCNIYRFVSFINDARASSKELISDEFADFDDLSCSQPKELYGKKLFKLDSNQFKCRITENCPPYCNCTITEDGKISVNCSNRRLKRFPDVAPSNATILDLSGNDLTSLSDLRKTIWQNVTEVRLNNNNIINVFEDWNRLSNLKTLSLDHNSLRVLPYDFMDYVANRAEFEISLGNNPWQCDCKTVRLKTWLSKNYNKINDINKVYCENKRDKNGTMNLIRVPNRVICPSDNWQHKNQLAILIVITTVITLLIFIILILFYKNRNTVIACLLFSF
ncbi:protein toll-like [Centruroides vittatus]|uniref:protein toll-like n=1 Tax=Centruroides vittatus TaxID=120091 RepID=UPI00350ED0D8